MIHSIPYFALVVENPARQTGWMCLWAEKLALPDVAAPGSAEACEKYGRIFTMQTIGHQMVGDPAPRDLGET